LIRSIKKLDELKLDEEEKSGVKIIKKALEEPMRQIAINAVPRRWNRSGKG
jgi:chaperonin GroEL (HSP60 family)